MKWIIYFMLSFSKLTYGSVVEKYFYVNEHKLMVKVEGIQLKSLKGIDPTDIKTIQLTTPDVLKILENTINEFKGEHKIKKLNLNRVGIIRFYTFSNGNVIWLWEAEYEIETAISGGSSQKISFFVTKDKSILIPRIMEPK